MKTNVTADAAVRLMLFHPFWSELYYSMKVIECEDEFMQGSQLVKMTLATDGVCLWVNPTFWKSLSLDHKISALAHETCHKMLLHSSRRGDRDPFIWNVACDHVVNILLTHNKFKPIPGYWICDMKYDGWSVEAVYQDLIKNLKQPPQGGGQGKPQPGKGGKGKGKGQPQPGDTSGDGPPQEGSPYEDSPDVPAEWKKMFRDVMKKAGSPQEIERHEAEVQQQVQKAMATARAMGHAPAGVEAPLAEAFEPAEEPWYNHLHRFMQELTIAEYNWARIDRRQAAAYGMIAPANYSESLGEVLVFIDCSGSCYAAAQQARFAQHVSAILSEAKPRKVVMAYFDTKVHFHEEIDVADMDVKTHPHGGGGTSFATLFDWAEQEGYNPAVAIVLTDMEGTFPVQGPQYPVIWADVYHQHAAPFGETIKVKP